MARKDLNLGLHRPKRVPERSRKVGYPLPRKGFIYPRAHPTEVMMKWARWGWPSFQFIFEVQEWVISLKLLNYFKNYISNPTLEIIF